MFLLVLLSLVFTIDRPAQGQVPGVRALRGEISGGEDPISPDRYMVELVDRGRPVDRVSVARDGSFEFRGIAEGQYELRVLTLFGEIVRREYISVHEYSSSLLVKLPENKGHRPVSGSVSIKSLLNPVPTSARKEFVRAEQALSKGRIDESIRRLEKAIQIHPGYMEAHNNLGVRYMRSGDFTRAAAEFQRAVEIDPASTLSLANLAFALVALNQHRDAEMAARRALVLDRASMQASYALGVSLAGQDNCPLEAVEILTKAAGNYPSARLTAARLLVCRGQPLEAAEQLRAYLESPATDKRPQVEQWLASLDHSPSR